MSCDLTLNPIWQVYVSDENFPLSEIRTSGEKLGEYPSTCPLGIVCVIKTETPLANPQPIIGKWVTIVDESNQPIVLSEIRVFGCKRDIGVPLVPGIPSLSFP